jgi:hypothetical protein
MRRIRLIYRLLWNRGRKAAQTWCFNSRGLARVKGRDHALCLGDSHVGVMRHVKVPGVWFQVEALGGATASGILNPNSTTGSLRTFSKRLSRAKPWQEVVLQLGEVDCGFLIWHRAQRKGLSVDEQLANTLDSYGSFIEQVAGMGFARVTVLSVPLPTISDLRSEWTGEVANLRREVTATKAERTALTLRFNRDLAQRCASLGVMFVDVTSGQLDPSTGLIDPGFLRKNNRNHHLAQGPYSRLISAQLVAAWRKPATGAMAARLRSVG